MQICRRCERPIKDKDNVWAKVTAVFHRDPKMPEPIHALEIIEEEYLEHLDCND